MAGNKRTEVLKLKFFLLESVHPLQDIKCEIFQQFDVVCHIYITISRKLMAQSCHVKILFQVFHSYSLSLVCHVKILLHVFHAYQLTLVCSTDWRLETVSNQVEVCDTGTLKLCRNRTNTANDKGNG